MSKLNLEERVAVLESQVKQLLARWPQPGPEDWKSAVGMFTGDEAMKEIDALGAAWREADRQRAKRPRKRATKSKS